jgi:cob(I)alamin adenosyltransferase
MKIYTKSGDDGSTGLVGGQRVSKCDVRIECVGAVDELNASLGMAAVGADEILAGMVREIQNELFVIGSHLATPEGQRPALPILEETAVDRLEMQIDSAEAQLPPLQQFILPGGSESGARLHFARTVCRRAERLVVDFAGNWPVPAIIVTYLNRLSDWLFVQARNANRRQGIGDIPWVKPS